MIRGKKSVEFEHYLKNLCLTLDIKIEKITFDYEHETVTIEWVKGSKKVINVACNSNGQVAIDVIKAII